MGVTRRAVAVSFPLAAILAAASVPAMFAADDAATPSQPPEMLVATPAQAEGPYYPVEKPADRDADLVHVAGAGSAASGQRLELAGRLLTLAGAPIEGAVIEIWQTDGGGVYLHPNDPGFAGRDVAFQGYGEAVTDAEGAWSFLTILPEVYGSRPRHIHAKVKTGDETRLTTQIYFSGGDIPEAGAVALTGGEADLLMVEAIRRDRPGEEATLRADHLLVLPDIDG